MCPKNPPGRERSLKMNRVIGKIEYKNVFKVFFAWQEGKEEEFFWF